VLWNKFKTFGLELKKKLKLLAILKLEANASCGIETGS